MSEAVYSPPLAKEPPAVPALSDFAQLIKPGITVFALITAAGGLSLAPGRAGFATWAFLVLGTFLLVGAANTLNMYFERESDCMMARTKKRPLPSGRMAPGVARGFGLLLAAGGVPVLTFWVNPLTGLLGVIAFLSYVFLYTPLKRRTTLATIIGSLPGAMPALMGYAAGAGTVDAGGLVVFGVLFVWQIPHFHAISMYRREEYRRAGLKVLPVERGPEMTRYSILLYLAVQVQLSLLLFPLGVAGRWYTVVAIILGVTYLVLAVRGVKNGGPKWARQLFLYSLLYLPLLFAAMVLDGALP